MNAFDDIAELAEKYGNLHERAVSEGDLASAELYRSATLDLCGVILKWRKP